MSAEHNPVASVCLIDLLNRLEVDRRRLGENLPAPPTDPKDAAGMAAHQQAWDEYDGHLVNDLIDEVHNCTGIDRMILAEAAWRHGTALRLAPYTLHEEPQPSPTMAQAEDFLPASAPMPLTDLQGILPKLHELDVEGFTADWLRRFWKDRPADAAAMGLANPDCKKVEAKGGKPKWQKARSRMIQLHQRNALPKSINQVAKLLKPEGFCRSTVMDAVKESNLLGDYFGLKPPEKAPSIKELAGTLGRQGRKDHGTLTPEQTAALLQERPEKMSEIVALLATPFKDTEPGAVPLDQDEADRDDPEYVRPGGRAKKNRGKKYDDN